MSCVSRCTGHCCREFTLPVGPEDLVECARYGRGERAGPTPEEHARGVRLYGDIEQIAEMVIYLGHYALDPALCAEGVEPGPSAHRYTCRHLQANGDCGIYESRPRMCRDYPQSGRCEWKACTRPAPDVAKIAAADSDRFMDSILLVGP